MTRRWKHRAIAAVALVALCVAGWLVVYVSRADPDAQASSKSERAAHNPDLLQRTGDVALALRAERALPRDADGNPIRRGGVEVHVTDRAGQGLYGIRVSAASSDPDETPRVAGSTDAQGYARFLDLPYDGTWQVSAGKAVPMYQSRSAILRRSHLSVAPTHSRATVNGPVVELQLPVLPVGVRVEASDNGTALDGVKVTLAPSVGGGGWETGDLLPLLALVPNRQAPLFRFDFFRPPDNCLIHDKLGGKIPISPGADRLLAVFPLRPRAELFVLPPEPGAWDYVVWVGGERVAQIQVVQDVYDRQRVRNVPFLPGAEVYVLAQTRDGKKKASGRAPFGQHEGEPLVVKLEPVGKDSAQAFAEFFGAHRTYIKFTKDITKDTWSFATHSVLTAAGEPKKARRVEIRVQGPDGRPAIGAFVQLGALHAVTDRLGRAVFEHVVHGTYTVKMWGVGPAWSEAITVSAPKRQVEHVRVPLGAIVDLQVEDTEGNQVPHARIAVEQAVDLPWCDIEDGEQRLDPFTDVQGRRLLRNLQPTKPIQITATFGQRIGTARVTLPPGQTHVLHIVLEKSKDAVGGKKRVGRPGEQVFEIVYKRALKGKAK